MPDFALNLAEHFIAVPSDPALAGHTGSAQGAPLGAGPQLTNALDIILGQ